MNYPKSPVAERLAALYCCLVILRPIVLPFLIILVETLTFFLLFPTKMVTVCRLGRTFRFVRMCECETFFSVTGFLPLKKHFVAILISSIIAGLSRLQLS